MRLTLARYLHFAELREGALAELLAVEKAIAAAREPATRALHAQASALRTSLGAHAAQKP